MLQNNLVGRLLILFAHFPVVREVALNREGVLTPNTLAMRPVDIALLGYWDFYTLDVDKVAVKRAPILLGVHGPVRVMMLTGAQVVLDDGCYDLISSSCASKY